MTVPHPHTSTTTSPNYTWMTSKPSGDPYLMRKIPLGVIDIDTHTQRPIERNNVERIKVEFDWRLFNPLTVYEAGDRFKVVGGQHHALAAKEKFGPDTLVWVKVVPFGSKEEMARLGLQDNIGQVAPTPVSEWRSRVRAGEPVYVAVNDLLNRLGVAVGTGSNQLQCVRQLEAVIKGLSVSEATEAVTKIITTLITAWPDSHDEYRFKGTLVRNVADLLEAYPEIDPVDFGRRLQVREAREFFGLGKSATRSNLVAIEMINCYNSRRKQNRLTWTPR